MMGKKSQTETVPPQHQQRQPGKEHQMHPRPDSKARRYLAAGKLKDRKALITGGDSGIGRAVALAFAKEGADVAVVYLNEANDAMETRELIEREGRTCHLYEGDVADTEFVNGAVRDAVKHLEGLDILVNNAGEQHVEQNFEELTDAQLHRTFATNIFGYFYMTRAALKHMKEGAAIINTTSVTAYEGHPTMVDYASTKGAIVAFTRSLAKALGERKIRVNGVAPGPIWTPLIPASFSEEHVKEFGATTVVGRPGEPDEVAPCYVFLASEDSSYMTGQILHPNGGRTTCS